MSMDDAVRAQQEHAEARAKLISGLDPQNLLLWDFDHSQNFMCICDAVSGRFLAASDRILVELGYSLDEILEFSFAKLALPGGASQAAHGADLPQQLASNPDWQLRRKDGSLLHLQ